MRSRSFIMILVTLCVALGSNAEGAPYVIRAQVVTAEGAFPGAVVRLVHQPPVVSLWPEDAPDRRVLEPIETDSDKEGRLEIALDLGFIAAEGEMEARPERDSAEPTRITLEPLVTTDLTVTVRDARGRPVDGAEVTFYSHGDQLTSYHERTVTDKVGRCPLPQVPLGGPYSLEVNHPEHPRLWRSDLIVETGQQNLSVDLDPAPWKLETVRGRVIDGAGDPLPGAEVGLSPPLGIAEYQTRADGTGRFELPRVKEGAYRLIATAPGLAPASRLVKVSASLEPLELVLGNGATLRGTIGGVKPAESAELGTRVYAEWWSQFLEGFVDGDNYRIDHLGVGKWYVTAYAGGSQVGSEIEIEPGQTEAELNFELATRYQVRGQLIVDGQAPARMGVGLQTPPEASISAHTRVGRTI